jgi:hypothetical protein
VAEPAAAPRRVLAVLETSFWVAAYRAEVAANVLDFFALVVPIPVEREILAREKEQLRREYPYATLFRHLRTFMESPSVNAPVPLPIFGAGEAAAIPLASQLRSLLLINERRAAAYARNLGILVVTVPSFVVALRAEEVISDRAARRKLALIASFTSTEFIDYATQLLDALS